MQNYRFKEQRPKQMCSNTLSKILYLLNPCACMLGPWNLKIDSHNVQSVASSFALCIRVLLTKKGSYIVSNSNRHAFSCHVRYFHAAYDTKVHCVTMEYVLSSSNMKSE